MRFKATMGNAIIRPYLFYTGYSGNAHFNTIIVIVFLFTNHSRVYNTYHNK